MPQTTGNLSCCPSLPKAILLSPPALEGANLLQSHSWPCCTTEGKARTLFPPPELLKPTHVHPPDSPPLGNPAPALKIRSPLPGRGHGCMAPRGLPWGLGAACLTKPAWLLCPGLLPALHSGSCAGGSLGIATSCSGAILPSGPQHCTTAGLAERAWPQTSEQ